MPNTLFLIVVMSLLVVGFFMMRQWKQYHIRRTGTLVMAKVIQVRSWLDSLKADISTRMQIIPFLGGRWRYELTVEWTDPTTKNTRVITSGIKRGLARFQGDDSLPV